MSLSVRSLVIISLLAAVRAVPVFAAGDGRALDAASAGADRVFGQSFNEARSGYDVPALPVPSRASAEAVFSGVKLEDITGQCLLDSDIPSAYPGLYRSIPSQENERIIKVYRFKDAHGDERRLEVYYTGGDWMKYGFTYFGLNGGNRAARADAYFIRELSTSDQEGGTAAPVVNPFDFQKLAGFITSNFLTVEGEAASSFASVASASLDPSRR